MSDNPLRALAWDVYEKAMNDAACKVALDVGANDGGYTNTLLRHGFEVHAFEPVPVLADGMRRRFADNPKVHVNQCCVCDRHGMLAGVSVLEAWTIGYPGMGGLQLSPSRKGEAPFDVQLITLDRYCEDLRIGLIKLDVDGYEYRVLRGAAKTIARDRPPILCEFGPYIKAIGGSPDQFVKHIFSAGYKVVTMDGKREFLTPESVMPHYPEHTTFDVMLMPVART